MVTLQQQIANERKAQQDAEKQAKLLRSQFSSKIQPLRDKLAQTSGKRRAVAQSRLDTESRRLRSQIEFFERQADIAKQRKNKLRATIGKGASFQESQKVRQAKYKARIEKNIKEAKKQKGKLRAATRNGAIIAGGKIINFDTGTVRDKPGDEEVRFKTGTKKRFVDFLKGDRQLFDPRPQSPQLIQANKEANKIRADLKAGKITELQAENKLRETYGLASGTPGETEFQRYLKRRGPAPIPIEQQAKEFKKRFKNKLAKVAVATIKYILKGGKGPVSATSLSGAEFGRYLGNRYRQGGTALIKSDFKSIGVGALKEVGDFVNFITGVKGITVDSRGQSYDGLIAAPARKAITYGQKLAREAFKGNVPQNVIAKDLITLGGNINKGIGTTVDVGNFVYKNPGLSLLIVGMAIEAGVIKSKQAFLKNPQENLGRALFWVFPGSIVKGGFKAIQLTTRAGKTLLTQTLPVVSAVVKTQSQVLKAKTLNQFVKVYNSYLRNYNKYLALKGKAKVLKGKDKARAVKIFESFEKGTYTSPSGKSIGKVIPNPLTLAKPTGTSIEKSKVLILQLKNKVPVRVEVAPVARYIRFDGKKIQSITKTDKALIDDLYKAYYTSGAEFAKLKKKIEKITGLKVKVFQKQVFDKNRNPVKVLDLKTGKTKNLVRVKIKLLEPKAPKGKAPKAPKVKKVDIKESDLPFSSKGLFNKKGSFKTPSLQRKSRSWYNKSNRGTKNKSKSTKQRTNQYRREITKGKKEVEQTKKRYEPKLKKQKQQIDRNLEAIKRFQQRARLSKQQQGSLENLVNKTVKQIKEYNTTLARYKREVTTITAKVKKKTNILLKKINEDLKFFKATKKEIAQMQKLNAKLKRLNILKAGVISATALSILLKEVNAILSASGTLSAVDTVFKQVSKSQFKPIKEYKFKRPSLPKIKKTTLKIPRTTIKPVKRIKSPPTKPPIKPPKKPPKKPPVKPLRKFTFPNQERKLKRGEKLAFNIFYREKGKVLNLGVKLPVNKALKRASNLIDNTTARSMELRVAGKTKAKDLKGRLTLSKFRLRKTKKVLKLVEKRKFAIDTSGEKKGLKITKTLKRKTRKKK